MIHLCNIRLGRSRLNYLYALRKQPGLESLLFRHSMKRPLDAAKPALFFGFFGPLIGVAALYVILLSVEAVSGRPVRNEQILDNFAVMLLIGWVFGLVPALLTGALLTRWCMSSTLARLMLTAAIIGAVVSLLFFGAIFGIGIFGPQLDRHLLGFVAPFALAGGVAAAVCAMLSRRYWLA